MAKHVFSTLTDEINWRELQRLKEAIHAKATTTPPPANPYEQGEVTTVQPDQVHSVRRDRQVE